MMHALPAPSAVPKVIICAHAWAYADGGWQTYASADGGDHVDGWCVYLRFDDGAEPFELDCMEDFDTKPHAERLIEDLSAAYPDAEVRWY